MTSQVVPMPIEILVVEDNPADADLAREAFRLCKFTSNVHIVSNGVAAMDFLRGANDFADVARPDIILLDLNLPGKDGREVLREFKGDSDLKTIPVVILTSSKAETDIVRSYENHANCVITKPVDFDGLLTIVEAIECFWFSVARMPERNA